eukprot:992602-Rhodomonas_salina.2
MSPVFRNTPAALKGFTGESQPYFVRRGGCYACRCTVGNTGNSNGPTFSSASAGEREIHNVKI